MLYEEYCNHTPEEDQMSYSQFDDMLWENIEHEVYEPLYEHGLLSICDPGCSGDIGLLLNGSYRGYIGGISQEGYFSHLAPDFSLAEEMKAWEPLADFFMKYVQKTQEFCDNLSTEQKRKALREREIVLSFQAAMEQQDWKEVYRLLQSITPKELSEKTTFFFKYHQKAVLQGLPEEPLATDFYREIERCRRWNYERYHGFYDERKKKVIQDGYEAHTDLAIPTFQQFFQTFVDMKEDV